jgi:exoribonuclease-2
MNQGKIVEYIDQGTVICAICLQDKGNRLALLTTSSREVNLSAKRALHISDPTKGVDLVSSRQVLLSRLKETEARRDQLKAAVQVRELWELVRDESGRYDFKYLAQLCFGEIVTGDEISALMRALFEDKLYFKLKDGYFLPNSEERVAEILRAQEEEARWEEIIVRGSALLKGVLRSERLSDCTPDPATIDLLTQLALYGHEAPDIGRGKELLARAGVAGIGEARSLLVKLGVWEEDQNLELLRREIPVEFKEQHLGAAQQLSAVKPVTAGREDLRALPTFTIDGPLTEDFDDALSFEVEGDVMTIGIHIADVAAVVLPDSSLDQAARERAASVYLPRCQVPMLPPTLSHDTLSLKEGLDRPAISLLARFDQEGNLHDFRFVASLVRIQRQLTYDQVNTRHMGEQPFEALYRLSRRLRQRRIDQGAMILSLPEVSIKVGAEGSIAIELLDQETPSRLIVGEMMIFHNWMVARFCRDTRIPILYRTQEEPSERLSIEQAGYLYSMFRQLRKLNPLLIDTEPKPHIGLGLDVYTNVTSPIRRYLDLVVQRQLGSFLSGQPPFYDEEALEKIRLTVEPTLRDQGIVRRNRTRYWIQKYLRQRLGERYPALVLDTMRSNYRVLLKDFLMVTELRREDGLGLLNGQNIMVRVKVSDPWLDKLTLEYAGLQDDSS